MITNRKTVKYRILFLWLVFIPFASNAAEVPGTELDPLPPPPEISDPIKSGEAMEPEVKIIRRGDATIEEYRVNGFLYAIKIIPSIGPAYYYIDRDGDGDLESRESELEDIAVPHWVIFSW